MAVRPVQLVFLVIPVGLLLASALKLFAFFQQRSNIWWTPLPMATPLALSGDRVEVYARGTDLRMLVEGGQVQIGGTVISVDDIRVRFNNRDQVRAEQIPMLLTYSFTVGAGLVLVAFTLAMQRRSKPLPSRQTSGSMTHAARLP